MRSREELYMHQSFTPLILLGAEPVYREHIRMLEFSLKTYTEIGDYNKAFQIQKDIQFFEQLIYQLTHK